MKLINQKNVQPNVTALKLKLEAKQAGAKI